MKEEMSEKRKMNRDHEIHNIKSEIKITKYFSPNKKTTAIECQV